MNSKKFKKYLEKIYLIDRIFLIIIFIASISLVLFFQTLGNPDHGAYWKLFTYGDYYSKLEFGHLWFFTKLTSFLNNFINYPSFRFALASFQLITLFFIGYKFKFRLSKLTFFTFLPFIAFILLKIHVQIRESLAILLWMITLINIEDKKFINPKNISLFSISLLFHISVILWWIPSIIFSIKKISSKVKLFLNLLFFSIVGVAAGSTRSRVFFDELIDGSFSTNFFYKISKYQDKNYLFIHGPNIIFPTVDITPIKYIYWIFCFFLIVFIWIDEFRLKTDMVKMDLAIDYKNCLGFIGLYGSLIFFPFATIFSFYEGLTNHGYNYIFRILFVLLFLLSLYRTINSPKNILTIILNSFLAINVFRILFNLFRIFDY